MAMADTGIMTEEEYKRKADESADTLREYLKKGEMINHGCGRIKKFSV